MDTQGEVSGMHFMASKEHRPPAKHCQSLQRWCFSYGNVTTAEVPRPGNTRGRRAQPCTDTWPWEQPSVPWDGSASVLGSIQVSLVLDPGEPCAGMQVTLSAGIQVSLVLDPG